MEAKHVARWEDKDYRRQCGGVGKFVGKRFSVYT